MPSIFEEAVKAFQFEHEFRCAGKKRNCRHLEFIEETYKKEISFGKIAELNKEIFTLKDSLQKTQAANKSLLDSRAEQEKLIAGYPSKLRTATKEFKESLKSHTILQLNKAREEWLDVQHLEDGTFASWVDSVFNVAIISVKEIK